MSNSQQQQELPFGFYVDAMKSPCVRASCDVDDAEEIRGKAAGGRYHRI